MNAHRLLSQLQRSGVILAPRGERLHVDAPKGVLTEEIQQMMAQHKPELMRLLEGVSEEESQPRLDAVAAMKLDDFAQAGLIVLVRSEVLSTDVLFVSDNVPESKLEGRPEVVYRTHELKKLARVPPDPADLRNVHMVKEILGGTIEDVKNRSQEDHQGEVGHAAEG